MSDFNKPKIRLHTVNMREQFVAPLMDGRLKAITRLNGRGYNTGDYLRFTRAADAVLGCPVFHDHR